MNIQISNNGRYLSYGNTIYDALLDESFDKDSLPLEYWINFLKENTIASYQHGIKSIEEIQKFLRESVYNLSTLLEDRESTKFMFEYERKFGDGLLNESIEDYSNILSESWDYIGTTLFEQSVWDSIKSGISKVGSSIKSGVSQAWNFVKEKGAPWFFENLRKALFSWGGAAIMAFLGHPSVQIATGGITTGLLITVWGAMLAYDAYEALQGRPNWLNIIIDIVSLVFTGAGASSAGKSVQAAGASIPKSQLSSLDKVLAYLSKTSVGKVISNLIKKSSSALSSVLSTVGKGIAWIGEKLGIKTLQNASSSIEGFIRKTFSTMGNFAKKSIKPVGTAAATGAAVYGIEKVTGGEGKTLGGAFKDEYLTQSQEQSLSSAFSKNKSSAVAGEDYPVN